MLQVGVKFSCIWDTILGIATEYWVGPNNAYMGVQAVMCDAWDAWLVVDNTICASPPNVTVLCPTETGKIPDSKDPRIDLTSISIRHFHVRSISDRHRTEGLLLSRISRIRYPTYLSSCPNTPFAVSASSININQRRIMMKWNSKFSPMS